MTSLVNQGTIFLILQQLDRDQIFDELYEIREQSRFSEEFSAYDQSLEFEDILYEPIGDIEIKPSVDFFIMPGMASICAQSESDSAVKVRIVSATILGISVYLFSVLVPTLAEIL